MTREGAAGRDGLMVPLAAAASLVLLQALEKSFHLIVECRSKKRKIMWRSQACLLIQAPEICF